MRCIGNKEVRTARLQVGDRVEDLADEVYTEDPRSLHRIGAGKEGR